MKPGDMFRADPYEISNNPALNQEPFVGLYLGFEKDVSGWRPGQHRVLGKDGLMMLWSNQWHLEEVNRVL